MKDEKWFLLTHKPNCFNKALVNLHNQGMQTFMPMHNVSVRKSGKPYKTQKPLFPSYIFVKVDTTAINWQKLRNTYGVSQIITLHGKKPTEVPSEVIDALKSKCNKDNIVPAFDNFLAGEKVRTVSGPLADIVATIDDIADNDRIYILFEMMGRNIKTLVNKDILEKVPAD